MDRLYIMTSFDGDDGSESDNGRKRASIVEWKGWCSVHRVRKKKGDTKGIPEPKAKIKKSYQ